MDPESRFREVFDAAYGPLCRYARHRGLAGPDADDLVAQVLEIAWRRLDEVPADEPLPWLYAVAHNLWRNQARKDRRRLDLLTRFSASLPSESVSDSTDPGVLRAALAALSESDQEVLRLVAWDGLTQPASPLSSAAPRWRPAPGCTAPAPASPGNSASTGSSAWTRKHGNSARRRDTSMVTAPIQWRCPDEHARPPR